MVCNLNESGGFPFIFTNIQIFCPTENSPDIYWGKQNQQFYCYIYINYTEMRKERRNRCQRLSTAPEKYDELGKDGKAPFCKGYNGPILNNSKM